MAMQVECAEKYIRTGAPLKATDRNCCTWAGYSILEGAGIDFTQEKVKFCGALDSELDAIWEEIFNYPH